MRRALVSILALLVLAVAAGSAVPASAAGGVFDDVTRTTPFARDIEWLAAEGITSADADRFRPDGPVTRQAMAVFLHKFAHDGAAAPGCTTNAYRDVRKSSPYCGSIRWLDRAGITSGTASGGFAPLAPVTRQSMAAFLHKLDSDGEAPEPCTVAPYADVPAKSPYCGSIDWLWTEGITTGTLGGNFAPKDSVTRGMMAAFLHRFSVARTTPLGVDVGWPQCGDDLPTDQAFGVVGVNHKKPRFFNPCFAEQLAWAARSSGARSQPKVQLYVNTANPAKTSDVWPCPEVTTTCARQYGVDRAREDLDAAAKAGLDPADHVWWLDVEDGNSWERTSIGRVHNRAVLEGMVARLRIGGVTTVGLYSTREQWAGIVGSVPQGSELRRLPTWLTGRTAVGIAPARRMCADAPLTVGGTVTMVQFVEDGFDRNLVC